MMELGQFLFGGVLIVFGCHALIPCVFIILSTGQAGTKQGPMEESRSVTDDWAWEGCT